jgi:hypothetical protein
MLSFDHLPEVHLQKLVRSVFADSAKIWADVDGKHLQVLSIGDWNHAEGPDFRHIALLVDGHIYIGDGEFHRRTSDWRKHLHHTDTAYKGLLLHIALHNDAQERFADFTLVVPQTEIADAVEREQTAVRALETPNEDIAAALEYLQEYAVRRLNYKTTEAQRILKHSLPQLALYTLADRFVVRQRERKLRPKGKVAAAMLQAEQVVEALFTSLVQAWSDVPPGQIHAALTATLGTPIGNAGKLTRTELVVNVLLPLLLALSTPEQHSAALAWFWSLPSANRYTVLSKRFPHIPQEYVWQQQGMLEYLAELRPVSRPTLHLSPSVVLAGKDQLEGVTLYIYTAV